MNITTTTYQYNLIPLDKINLSENAKIIQNKYRELPKEVGVTRAAFSNRELKKRNIILDQIDNSCSSFLDISCGIGQMTNIAAASGRFSTVLAADKKRHSALQIFSDFEYSDIDINGVPNPEYRSDVVVSVSGLEKLSMSRLFLTIQNLQFLAQKQLIVVIPYAGKSEDQNNKKTFNLTRIESLFTNGKVTLISEGNTINWAMIVMDGVK